MKSEIADMKNKYGELPIEKGLSGLISEYLKRIGYLILISLILFLLLGIFILINYLFESTTTALSSIAYYSDFHEYTTLLANSYIRLLLDLINNNKEIIFLTFVLSTLIFLWVTETIKEIWNNAKTKWFLLYPLIVLFTILGILAFIGFLDIITQRSGNLPKDLYIGLGTLAGALVGFIGSIITNVIKASQDRELARESIQIEYDNQEKLEDKKILGEKLEECYLLATEIKTELNTITKEINSYYYHNLSKLNEYFEGLDLKNIRESIKRKFERLEMISNLYFKDLYIVLDDYKSGVEDLILYIDSLSYHVKNYLRGTHIGNKEHQLEDTNQVGEKVIQWNKLSNTRYSKLIYAIQNTLKYQTMDWKLSKTRRNL